MTALYEYVGPDRDYVIEYITNKLVTENEKEKETETEIKRLEKSKIQEIVEDTIPQDKIDFGSWRGWSTFGLEETIKKTIEKKLELHRIPKD